MKQKVRVCGPNLNDQSKGTFHVHVDGCLHLHHYGPGTIIGGDVPGFDETVLEVDSQVEVVEVIYSDQLRENGDVKPEDWLDDFYFAPCTKSLPTSFSYLVYECWVANHSGSFVKHTERDEVIKWAAEQLDHGGKGAVLMIGIHSSDEYVQDDTQYAADSADGTMTQS